MKGLLTVFSLALLLGSAAISAAAQSQFDQHSVTGNSDDLETYVKLFGGLTFDSKFRNIEGTQGATGVTAKSLSLKSSALYGIKLGVFPTQPVGLEVEAFNSTPHSKQQAVTVTGPGGSVSGTLTGIDNRVTVLAFNIIGRYPGGVLQPYIGVGPALFFVRSIAAGRNASDTTIGFNAQAGLNVRFGRRWGVFGEYKYNWAKFRFDNIANFGAPVNEIGLKGIYSNNAIVAGVNWYF